MILRVLLLLLLTARLGAPNLPAVIPPTRVVLPATEFTLRLGMPFAAVEAALRPLELDERGEDGERLIYSTAVDVGTTDYTVDFTFEGDSLVRLAIFAVDSGLVDAWFRARVDSLPLSTSYERTLATDDLIRELWTTSEAVWITEHVDRPTPGVDMTFWEFRLR